MNRSGGITSTFALVAGIFLLIEGAWGLVSPVVFGVFTTNLLHAIIHLALGAVGVWTGLRGGARGFCLFLGVLLVAVGALWHVPGIGDLIRSLLNANAAVAIFNLVVGAVALVVVATQRRGAGA